MKSYNFAIVHFAIAFFCVSVIYFAPDHDDPIGIFALILLAMYSGGKGGYYLHKGIRDEH